VAPAGSPLNHRLSGAADKDRPPWRNPAKTARQIIRKPTMVPKGVNDVLGTILWALIGGTILGYLAKLLLPGRQNIPAWATIGAGIVAALLGGLIADWLGIGNTRGIDWWKHIIQIALAVLAVWLVARLFAGGRGTTTRRTSAGY
jgi:uncharacterized membrane protein YeaQ/YmgE (transglycosylase-associated protein family)